MSDDTSEHDRNSSDRFDEDRDPSDRFDDDRDSSNRVRGGNLQPREIDRLFDLLEEALAADALTDEQFDRLLAILEQAVADASADPETLAELLSLLEAFLLDPNSINEVDVDGFLELFEEALASVAVTDRDALEDVFDVIEEGIRDPTSVEPEDVEQLQSSLQNTLVNVADPTGSFDALHSLSSLADEDDQDDTVDLFRIARLGAAMTQRASGYSVESGVRVGTRLAYAAANAESPAKLLKTTRAIALDELRQAGIDIGDEQAAWLETYEEEEEAIRSRPLTREALEERGARLISRSSDVGRDESIHPAFASMLDQLSTDEARILRLLATQGPQGVIDVYNRQYLPPKRTRVARNLTMLGRDAGCRIQRRTPVYVQNLQRLGVAEVSDEPIQNLKRYEVIEAQSHVERARALAKRPRTEYKRVQLTDLGVEFCELCFPFDVRVDGEGLLLRENTGAEE